MTDILIRFSASRFSRFSSAFNRLVNSPDDGTPSGSIYFFKQAFTFYPEHRTVSVRLSPSEHISFTRDHIWLQHDWYVFTPLPRYNGYIIQVTSA